MQNLKPNNSFCRKLGVLQYVQIISEYIYQQQMHIMSDIQQYDLLRYIEDIRKNKFKLR